MNIVDTIKRVRTLINAKWHLEKEQFQNSICQEFELKVKQLKQEYEEETNAIKRLHEEKIQAISASLEELNSLHQKNLETVNASLSIEKLDKKVLLTYIENLTTENVVIREKLDLQSYRCAKEGSQFQSRTALKKPIVAANQKVVKKEQLESMHTCPADLQKCLLVERTKTLANEMLINHLKQNYADLKGMSNAQKSDKEKVINEMRIQNEELSCKVSVLQQQIDKQAVENNTEKYAKIKDQQTEIENGFLREKISFLEFEITKILNLNSQISSLEDNLRVNKVFYENLNRKICEEIKELNEQRSNYISKLKELFKQETNKDKRKLSEMSSENESANIASNKPSKKTAKINSILAK